MVLMIELTMTFEVTSCANCGMPLALPSDFERERRRDHKSFYCPRGHSQYFPGESDLEKAERERKAAERQRDYARAARTAAEDQARTAEYRRRAEKAAKTRLQNRIAAGVCPCCKRNFANVKAHIQGQHPTFAAEHAL
jgi:hypothetical protein